MPQVEGASPAPYATLGQNSGSTNLLGPLTQFAYAQNALNQNALFQQQFRARAAMGPIAQASIDPQTGQMDYNKFLIGIATHPETAFMAPEIANQVVARQLTQAQLLKTNMEIANQRQAAIGSAAYAAANNMIGDPSAPADTSHVVNNAASLLPMTSPDGMKLFDRKQVVAQLTTLTSGAKTNGDLKAKLLQYSLAALRGSDMLGNIGWQTVNDPTTGQPKLVAFNKLTGAPAGASLPGQTPQDANGPTTFGPSRSGASAAPGGPSMGAGPSPGSGPASSQLNGLSASPVVSTPSGPTTAQQGGLDYIGKTYFPQLQEAARQSQNYLNTVQEGKELLRDVGTGRASEMRLDIARWLTSAGVSEETAREVAGGDPYNAQALQKLILYIGTQGMRQANAGNAAVRSVQEWHKFMEANPNLTNDKQAINKMWDFMQYQNSLVTQEQQEYNKWQATGRDVTQFPAKWNNFVNQQTQKYMQSRRMSVPNAQ